MMFDIYANAEKVTKRRAALIFYTKHGGRLLAATLISIFIPDVLAFLFHGSHCHCNVF